MAFCVKWFSMQSRVFHLKIRSALVTRLILRELEEILRPGNMRSMTKYRGSGIRVCLSDETTYRMDAHAGEAMLNPLMITSSRSTRMMIGRKPQITRHDNELPWATSPWLIHVETRQRPSLRSSPGSYMILCQGKTPKCSV